MRLKENRKIYRVGAAFLAAFLFLGLVSFENSNTRLMQKLNAAVEGAFAVQDFSLDVMQVDTKVNKMTAVEFGKENLYAIKKGGALLGYAYLGQAPSMKNIFDYTVLLTPDLQIKKSKVLIYREDYGRQIGSQRWLKQFIGKKAGEKLGYGEDVDAIAGATISAKSMTKAVNDVLASIKVLQEKSIL
ncbi:MAG: FMN-binding protein [Bacteroidota bacterium]